MTKLLTKIEFSQLVEEVARVRDLTLIESCIVVAEEHDIEYSDVPLLIYPTLQDKLKVEAIENRTMSVPKQLTLAGFFD